MNEREVFAFVLLNLVRGQCAASGSDSVSRTGLQAQVPVKERAFARRGLSALIEHRALLMRGEQIGLTARGHLYLDEHVLEAEERPTLDATQDADLLSLRSAIRQDMRLSHDSIEAAHLALDVYRDAVRDGVEQLVICSNDSDMEPVLQFARQDMPGVTIGLVMPLREGAKGQGMISNKRLTAQGLGASPYS